jgi:hypothetical protein
VWVVRAESGQHEHGRRLHGNPATGHHFAEHGIVAGTTDDVIALRSQVATTRRRRGRRSGR